MKWQPSLGHSIDVDSMASVLYAVSHMELRRLLESIGMDIRGFLQNLGIDVETIEASTGVAVEVLAVGLIALVAAILFGTALATLSRRRRLAGGPATAELGEGPERSERTSDAEALYRGLSRTRTGFLSKLEALLGRDRGFDEGLVEELETLLVTSDIGIRTAQRLIAELQNNLEKEERGSPQAIRAKLKNRVELALGQRVEPWGLAHTPTVVMVIGVNGVGKTTTIGKLAARYTEQGKKVVLAAGDTFRAAAVEQLEVWAERAGAEVVKGEEGADPASVIYTAVEQARATEADLVLCDTAGRLQTKVNLMNELSKVHRVIGKAMEGAPHEVLLVLDATTGQNAISQAQKFSEAVPVNSLVLSKLDGTAKGGVVVAVADELDLPVRFVGVGEGIDDLRDFDPETFVEALFAERRDTVDAPSAHS